jgi:hypothetical protein
MKEIINDWKSMLIFSLTLGLAPFVPEPHIFGKVRWLMGGGVGMQLMDYWDFVMHGTPWVLLFRVLLLKALGRLK